MATFGVRRTRKLPTLTSDEEPLTKFMPGATIVLGASARASMLRNSRAASLLTTQCDVWFVY